MGRPQFVAAAGQFYLAYGLAVREVNAALTLGNAPSVDVLASSTDGRRRFHSKSRQPETHTVNVGCQKYVTILATINGNAQMAMLTPIYGRILVVDAGRWFTADPRGRQSAP